MTRQEDNFAKCELTVRETDFPNIEHFPLNITEPEIQLMGFSHPIYPYLLLENWPKLLFTYFFFGQKFRSFIEKKKIYVLIFYSRNIRKHLAIAVKCMKDGENRISFIEDVEITEWKN